MSHLRFVAFAVAVLGLAVPARAQAQILASVDYDSFFQQDFEGRTRTSLS